MCRRPCSDSVAMLCSPTQASPRVGIRNPVMMRMVVDLPAPLGPRKPTISPCSTDKLMSSTARRSP